MTISNEVDRKKIRDAMQEISDSMTRIEAERDLIKEIKATLKEEFELPAKTISKMARVYHKQNFQQEQAEAEEFESLYEEVVLIANSQ